ncbi:MAG: hypothetical protein HY719_11000 [Planctomycetes bacterium]|nr:hypothetical protein [Planctomycetota bacterium]
MNTALAQGGGLVITESAGDQRTDLTTTSGDVTALAARGLGFTITIADHTSVGNDQVNVQIAGATNNAVINTPNAVRDAINAAIATDGDLAGRVAASTVGNTVVLTLTNAADDGKLLSFTIADNANGLGTPTLTGGAGGSTDLNATVGSNTVAVTVGTESQTLNLDAEIGASVADLASSGNIVTAMQAQADSLYGAGELTVSYAGGRYVIQANDGVGGMTAALTNGGGVSVTAANAGGLLALDTGTTTTKTVGGATLLNFGSLAGGIDNVATALGLAGAVSNERAADGQALLGIGAASGGIDNVATALSFTAAVSNERTGDGQAALGIGAATGGTDNVATALQFAGQVSTERTGDINASFGGAVTFTESAATGVDDARAMLAFTAPTVTQQATNLETNEHLQFVVSAVGDKPVAVAQDRLNANLVYTYDQGSNFDDQIVVRNTSTGAISSTIDISGLGLSGAGRRMVGLFHDTTRGSGASGALMMQDNAGTVYQYDLTSGTFTDRATTAATSGLALGGAFSSTVTPGGADGTNFFYAISGGNVVRHDLRGQVYTTDINGGSYVKISEDISGGKEAAVSNDGSRAAYLRHRQNGTAGTNVDEIVVTDSSGTILSSVNVTAVLGGADATNVELGYDGANTRVLFEFGGNTYLSTNFGAAAALDGGGETNAKFAPNGSYITYQKAGDLKILNASTASSITASTTAAALAAATTFNPSSLLAASAPGGLNAVAYGVQTMTAPTGPLSQGRFDANSTELTFVDAAGKVFRYFYNGTTLSALRSGDSATSQPAAAPVTHPSGFFEGSSTSVPTAGQAYAIDEDNSLSKMRFYILIGKNRDGSDLAPNDADGPDQFFVFSQSLVDPTIITDYTVGTVGTEYVTTNVSGQKDLATPGQGLRFTIRPDGQLKKGDVLTIDASTVVTGRIDEGPNIEVNEGGVTQLFDQHGGAVTFRAASFIASKTNTSRFEITSDHKVQIGLSSNPRDTFQFSLVPLTLANLGLSSFDLRDGGGATFSNVTSSDTLFDNNLFLDDGPRLGKGQEVTAYTETFTLTFTSDSTFDVSGSNYGTISTGNRFNATTKDLTGLSDAAKAEALQSAPINVINIRGIEMLLRGKPTTGATFSFAFDGKGNIEKVDEAMRRVVERRADLGSLVRGMESALTSTQVNQFMVTKSESTIRDADVAEESGRLVREQILQASAQSVIQRMMQSRQILADSLARTLRSAVG